MHFTTALVSSLFLFAVNAIPAENQNFKDMEPSEILKANEGLDGPAPAGCYWDGTAPFCAGSCPPGYTEENRGSCGDGACCWTGYKVLCCKIPPNGESKSA
ncbi:hypothetical protein HD806DRAFT_536768 [Xylariaceae sp. AK1471]|nr:hypothetical protein HD806DRAFT_536768 [Xylariaceae sp. AK1471]